MCAKGTPWQHNAWAQACISCDISARHVKPACIMIRHVRLGTWQLTFANWHCDSLALVQASVHFDFLGRRSTGRRTKRHRRSARASTCRCSSLVCRREPRSLTSSRRRARRRSSTCRCFFALSAAARPSMSSRRRRGRAAMRAVCAWLLVSESTVKLLSRAGSNTDSNVRAGQHCGLPRGD